MQRRRKARELALKLLYQHDLSGAFPEDVLEGTELFRGETPVEGHLLAPDQPLFDALPHPNAWGFIPKQRLEPRTTYTAVARWLGHERRWSFTTGK